MYVYHRKPILFSTSLSIHTKLTNFALIRIYGEPAISLHSHHVSLVQWTTRLLPQGVLMWNCDSPVSVVSLHWWPDLIDHCGLVWGGPRPETSLGPRVIIPLDLTQLSCPGFTLAAGHPSGVDCWGEALWRACNLTSFSPCLTGPVDNPFASHHEGPRFKSPGGYLSETGILLLALSHYRCISCVLKGTLTWDWKWFGQTNPSGLLLNHRK